MDRQQAEDKYYRSLTNAAEAGYGLLQVSKLRWAIVTVKDVARIYFGCSDVRRIYFVTGCESMSFDKARDELLRLCKTFHYRRLLNRLKDNGKEYLDSLSDEEFGNLPTGAIQESGLSDYCVKRLSRMEEGGE